MNRTDHRHKALLENLQSNRRSLEAQIETLKEDKDNRGMRKFSLTQNLNKLLKNTRDTDKYKDIINFPISTVQSHKSELIFGTLEGIPIVAMVGRFHYYEGWSMQEVVFPIRVLKFLGIENLILSNASGGVNPNFKVGDIMVIKDHINMTGKNPLVGPNIAELGPRFPDMLKAYNPKYIEIASKVADKNKSVLLTSDKFSEILKF